MDTPSRPWLRLIEVPFNAAGRKKGVARMAATLREAGLTHRLPSAANAEVSFPPLIPLRGESGFLAEAALVGMVHGVSTAVGDAWRSGELPLVIGGDCPVLLGGLAALNSHGGGGLVFVDGHEDAWTPQQSPTGEASDSEIGLALGLIPAPPGLTEVLPRLLAQRTLILGPRDLDEIVADGAASLAGNIRLFTSEELKGLDRGRLGEEIKSTAAQSPAGWWFHIDLDVLSSTDLAAVDYPQPGGLSWAELEELTETAVKVPGCRGASVVSYNPDLDDGAAAARINEYLTIMAAGLAKTEPPVG